MRLLCNLVAVFTLFLLLSLANADHEAAHPFQTYAKNIFFHESKVANVNTTSRETIAATRTQDNNAVVQNWVSHPKFYSLPTESFWNYTDSWFYTVWGFKKYYTLTKPIYGSEVEQECGKIGIESGLPFWGAYPWCPESKEEADQVYSNLALMHYSRENYVKQIVQNGVCVNGCEILKKEYEKKCFTTDGQGIGGKDGDEISFIKGIIYEVCPFKSVRFYWRDVDKLLSQTGWYNWTIASVNETSGSIFWYENGNSEIVSVMKGGAVCDVVQTEFNEVEITYLCAKENDKTHNTLSDVTWDATCRYSAKFYTDLVCGEDEPEIVTYDMNYKEWIDDSIIQWTGILNSGDSENYQCVTDFKAWHNMLGDDEFSYWSDIPWNMKKETKEMLENAGKKNEGCVAMGTENSLKLGTLNCNQTKARAVCVTTEYITIPPNHRVINFEVRDNIERYMYYNLLLPPILIKWFIIIVLIICYISYFKFYKKLPHSDFPHYKFLHKLRLRIKWLRKNWYWHTCFTGKKKENKKNKKKKKSQVESSEFPKSQVESSEARDSRPYIKDDKLVMKFTYEAEVAIPINDQQNESIDEIPIDEQQNESINEIIDQ